MTDSPRRLWKLVRAGSGPACVLGFSMNTFVLRDPYHGHIVPDMVLINTYTTASCQLPPFFLPREVSVSIIPITDGTWRLKKVKQLAQASTANKDNRNSNHGCVPVGKDRINPIKYQHPCMRRQYCLKEAHPILTTQGLKA